jgi:hypothetical protein
MSAREPIVRTERVGCWAWSGASLERSPAIGESPHYWADVDAIALPPGRRRIVLLGESTARGYLYDPAFTPAGAIAGLLDRVLGRGATALIDLARTNASPEHLLNLTGSLGDLEPAAVVLWAGNNWFPFENLPRSTAAAVASAVRDGGNLRAIKDVLETAHRQRVRDFLRHLARALHDIGAELIVVVPEFNLAGWHDALDEPPAMPRTRRAAWNDAHRRLRTSGDSAAALEEIATELTRLDEGLASAGPLMRGMLCVQSDPRTARRLLEHARDAELWPKSPRPHQATCEELRRAAAAHSAEIVDLPALFAATTGHPVPSPSLFLDYCHHSHEGLRIAVAAIASAVLERAFDVSIPSHELAPLVPAPPPSVDACARFLAAVHNAAFAQPVETLRRHIAEALHASPAVERPMARYVRDRLAPAPHALAGGHTWCRQMERYFAPGGLNRGSLDLALVDVIVDTIAPPPDMLQLLRPHALRPEPTDLLCPAYAQLFAMDERTLEPCAFHRSRRRVSSFVIVTQTRCAVRLDLSYRTPDAAEGELVRITCRERLVATLPASPDWTRAAITVPPDAVDLGANVVKFVWPASTLGETEILARYVRDLEQENPMLAPYPVLGEIFTLRGSV